MRINPPTDLKRIQFFNNPYTKRKKESEQKLQNHSTKNFDNWAIPSTPEEYVQKYNKEENSVDSSISESPKEEPQEAKTNVRINPPVDFKRIHFLSNPYSHRKDKSQEKQKNITNKQLVELTVAEQLKKDKIEGEKIELEIDAKNEIEWFQTRNPKHSTEEILLDMAKYLVLTEKKYNRTEGFFSTILNSVTIGSIFGAVIFLVSGEWTNLSWCIIIFIICVVIEGYLYGTKNKK